MTTGRVGRVAAVVLVTAFGVVGPASAASAQYRVVPDRGGPGDTYTGTPDGDVAQVRIGHRAEGTSTLRILPESPGRIARLYDVLVDTDRDGRPDLVLDASLETEDVAIRTAMRMPPARRLTPVGGERVCRDVPLRRTGAQQQGQGIVFVLPTRCLGDTDAIRLSVRVASESEVLDWLPAPRAWSAPVRRG